MHEMGDLVGKLRQRLRPIKQAITAIEGAVQVEHDVSDPDQVNRHGVLRGRDRPGPSSAEQVIDRGVQQDRHAAQGRGR